MEKYRVASWQKRPIEAVDCECENDKYVWIVQDWLAVNDPYVLQRAKTSQDERYFDTWDDAQRWLIETQEQIVEGIRTELERSERLLDRYRSISEHEEE